MENSRRDFLKLSGLVGAGTVVAGLTGAFQQAPRQRFNMSGYAAPRLDSVRVGIIGTGNRGRGTTRRLAQIEGVEIKAVCDLEADRVRAAIESIGNYSHSPDAYSGGEDEWKKVCDRPDIDLIYIATPWHLHGIQAVYAMDHDKHVYMELPAANTLEECWQLVETSERTRKHCMMVASSCHTGLSAVVLNMARQGLFGEIIHGEGAYIHDLLENYNFNKAQYHNMWRLEENSRRNGSLYPQHGLGPVAQIMDLNYGDKMDYLVSVSSNDFLMGDKARELASTDPFWEPYVGRPYRGNMNVTTIRTNKGRTIMIQHDVSSPRPGVRFSMLSGTKGIYQAGPPRIAFSHDGWIPQEEFNALREQYTPAINRRFAELARNIRPQQHSGYSRVNEMDWRLIDCLRNGLPIEMDVYDAALWTCVTPLSEWSVANRSTSIEVPDFTNGAWASNKRGMDIDLQKGGGDTLLI